MACADDDDRWDVLDGGWCTMMLDLLKLYADDNDDGG